MRRGLSNGFAGADPHFIRAEKKGRTKAEVDEMICRKFSGVTCVIV